MRPWLRRHGAPLLVAALCALGFWARLYVNAPRDGIAHGDTGYYMTLARNLALGRGFFIDYVPDFLGGDKRLPNPANTYWQPLTSVLIAAAMAVFGTGFGVAKVTMSAVSALAPAVGYLLGREMFGRRRHGLVAAALATTSEGYLSAACQPQTHALLLVIGGAWLWLALKARRDERWLVPLGLATGLLHLTRGDAILLWPALLLSWLVPDRGRPRWSGRGVAKLAAAYALVMAPLWIHNLAALGRPMPSGLGRVAFLRSYSELYALPETLTLEHYLDAGAEAILASKLDAAETNGMTLLIGAATGNDRAQIGMVKAHHWPLLVLVWLGWPLLARRRFLPIWGTAAIYWLFLTLVLSFTGTASLRAVLFPFHLASFAGAGRVLDLAAQGLGALAPGRAGRLARAGAAAAGALLIAWIGWSQVSYAAQRTRHGVHFIHEVEVKHAALMKEVILPLGLEDAVIMTRDVHETHVHTGLDLVMIPFEPVEVIHRVARELGVTHVVLWGIVEQHRDVHPGTAAIPFAKDRFEEIRRAYVRREPVRVYRVLE